MVKNAVLVPARLWRITCLCVVLLVAQTLGQLHGLTHVTGHSPQPESQVSQVSPVSPVSPVPNGVLQRHAQETDDHGAHGPLFDGLFASHNEGSADCLAFDQISHFDTLVSFSLALPMALTTFQLTASAGLAVARWHAQFQARGPPFPH
jgi:hypothetical protein